MKILCLERDNTTYQSRDDEGGNSYRASFELFPFHEGKDHAVFKGMMNGQGPKRGGFCAVKAKVTCPAGGVDWRSLVETSKAGRKMASQFHKCIRRRVISFTQPLVAQMHRVSDFNGVARIFQPHEKRLKEKEFVIIEDFIEGRFQRFSSASGVTVDSGEADMTQAFSHFTWHQTKDYVICGLQGVQYGGQYEFTSPTVHSLSGRFGANDCGFAGISEFFAHHRCNNVCMGWDTPFRQTPRLQNQSLDLNHCPPDLNHCLRTQTLDLNHCPSHALSPSHHVSPPSAPPPYYTY